MRLLISLICVCVATAAAAQDPVLIPYDGSFDDATFAVESTVLGKGLVIDFVSHTGDMLNRTAGDVGSVTTIFDNADIFLFCSAVVSRSVMEADPNNIQYCPYAVFVTEANGDVQIGYRTYPEGPMQQVQALLKDIATEASEF